MSNVKQVAAIRTAKDLDAAVIAFKSAEAWREDVNQMWAAIRDAALVQFESEQSPDPVAGGDSY